ncbi:hypothetical protein EIP86_001348 [Pleurotus ostreatoroseus]|nr:hypothetical protein EIP86_001348 [Pleurotus ostreatoroseus]
MATSHMLEVRPPEIHAYMRTSRRVHALQYSKSSRATCHGPPPCKGTPIAIGALRYGQVSFSEFGEVVEWRHWGCVTPDILGRLATTRLERVPGFSGLRREDQNKVRMAIGLRRVDPADVPASAKAAPPASAGAGAGASTATPGAAAAAGPSQAKRKAAFEARQASAPMPTPSASQPAAGSSQRPRNLAYTPTAAEIADDEIEEVQPTQEESVDELYTMFNTNVVGVQYYKGLVGAGEEVRLVREPRNRYDRNAIKVENIGGTQVGHVPRDKASLLAPLIDRGSITVEGVMHEGNLTGFSYSLSMTIKIYGPSDKKAQMERSLLWATPGNRGFAASANANARGSGAAAAIIPKGRHAASVGAAVPYSFSQAGPSRAAPTQPQLTPAQIAAQQEAARKQQEALQKARELRGILDSLEKVDDEGRRSSLLDTLCAVEDVLALPEHPSPPSLTSGDLKVNLLKHQSQALQWCIDREYPKVPTVVDGPPVQFWQLRKAGAKQFYFNIATKTPQEAPPVLGRGALCADSMGLGKTLTMLSLIVATKADIPLDHSNSTLIGTPNVPRLRNRTKRGDLLVVPLSVLSNWEKQIEDHVSSGVLSYCVYYGAGRNMSANELKKYDVVITTYQTVVKDGGIGGRASNGEPSSKKKKAENALFGVKWKVSNWELE